jgi:hypothetical protein
MSKIVLISKDENRQSPIPTAWRKALSDVVEALKDGDFTLEQGVAGVRPVSSDCAARMASNVEKYGARLTSLPDAAWDTSACQWMRSYWDVLIDLFTHEEGASDLALAVRVYEVDTTYEFEIQSLHVP